MARIGLRCPTNTTVSPARARATMASQHFGLGVGIEVRGGFVEQQHRRGGAQRAGQPEPLPLTERQAGAVAAEHGVQTVRQSSQYLVESDSGTGGIEVDQRAEQGEVLGHRAGNQHRALREPRQLAPPRLGFEVDDIDIVDGDSSRRRPGESGDHLQGGGLARAVRSGQHGHPTRRRSAALRSFGARSVATGH